MRLKDIQKPKSIGISISESPDMGVFGLSDGHLRDAMVEMATHLLASGADLSYGGDLRENGFTEMLFELVLRYSRYTDTNNEARVTNYFAWPVHIRMAVDSLDLIAAELNGAVLLNLLDKDGGLLTMEDRKSLKSHEADDDEWAAGLTAMRQTMRGAIDARILLGGRVVDYKGSMPGVAEEALLSLQSRQAVFLLGGFGGCTRDIAETLGLVDTWAGSRESWPGRSRFKKYGPDNLENGLSLEENQVLARTPYIDQSVTLVLRGLHRLRTSGTHVDSDQPGEETYGK